jgi:hypothetical protein
MLLFLQTVRGKVHAVVGSVLFDYHGGPWISVLTALADPVVMRDVVGVGDFYVAVELVNKLRFRFDYELVNVLSQSNVTRSLFDRIFRRRPRPEDLIASIRRGDFRRIAQSKFFFERTLDIDRLLVVVLRAAEANGSFVPNAVSHAQRVAIGGTRHMRDFGARSGQGHRRDLSLRMVDDLEQRHRLVARFNMPNSSGGL